MDGLEDLFRDPNGPAYQTQQTRVGPPLEYVAQKLGTALGDLHRAAQTAQAAGATKATDEEASGLGRDLRLAFLHALVAYLALGNMLALAEDPGALTERLLGSTREEFDAWLRHVEQGSSVTG
jgi:hypothetical protein